jgi:hypothetical protein
MFPPLLYRALLTPFPQTTLRGPGLGDYSGLVCARASVDALATVV